MFPIATILDPRFKNLHFRDSVACQQAIVELKKFAKVQYRKQGRPIVQVSTKNSNLIILIYGNTIKH